MPVREYSEKSQPLEARELLPKLVSEWKKNSPDGEPDAPIILLKKQKTFDSINIYVVWDKWANLDQIERSEIIMNAAEDVMPRDELVKVVAAMGVTQKEADRMGIEYRTA